MLSPSWQAILEPGEYPHGPELLLEEGKQVHYIELFKPPYVGRVKEFRLVDKRVGLCGKCRSPVIPKRILIRVRLDKNKRLIYRRRPPLPGMGMGTGRKPAIVWLVGWQQTLHHFTDLRGNPANVQSVAVLNQDTGEVFFLDRYVEDVGAGTHEPELYPVEIQGGVRAVLDGEGKLRPETGALELEEEKNRDVAGLDKVKEDEM